MDLQCLDIDKHWFSTYILLIFDDKLELFLNEIPWTCLFFSV
jgi:hypothetical protein